LINKTLRQSDVRRSQVGYVAAACCRRHVTTGNGRDSRRRTVGCIRPTLMLRVCNIQHD